MYVDHRDLHVRTHSFPKRRSADLPAHRLAQVEMREAEREHDLDLPDDPHQRGRRGGEADIPAGRAERRQQSNLARLAPRPEHRAERVAVRSEEHTSELPSLMRLSYAVFCLKKKHYSKQQTP